MWPRLVAVLRHDGTWRALRPPAFGLCVVVVAGAGCASVGEAVAGVCAAVALRCAAQAAAEACEDFLCGDDDIDAAEPVDAPSPELPPPPPERLPPTLPDGPPADVACRASVDSGGVWVLGCVDGTAAIALDTRAMTDTEERTFPARASTHDGDVRVRDTVDVASLVGVRAITGSLHVSGPLLLRLRLPSLRRVDGDLVIDGTPRLVRLELPALVELGGGLLVRDNAALAHDPVPALRRARHVDVAGNAALPTEIARRLHALPL